MKKNENEADALKCNLLHIDDKKRSELIETLPFEDNIQKVGDFFKVFGEPTRIKILYLVSNDELCVCDIANILNMSDSAISHQLKILKVNRLVKSRREGKSNFYSLDDEHIKTILMQGLNHIEE